MAQMLMQLIIAVGIVIYNFYRQAGRKRDGSVYAHWSHRLFHHHADAGYRDRVADCGGAKLGTRKCHPHAECLLGRRRAGLLYCAGVSRYAYCTGTTDVSPVYSCCCRGDYAVLQTRIMALALPFVAISLLASEYYQAIGKPWYSVLLTLMRHVFISVPVVYLLAIVLEMRITGVYFGAMSGTLWLRCWRGVCCVFHLVCCDGIRRRCAPNTWIWRWHHDVGQSVVVATGTVPIIDQLYPYSAVNIIGGVVTIEGIVDLPRLHAAIQSAIRQFDALRMWFVMGGE